MIINITEDKVQELKNTINIITNNGSEAFTNKMWRIANNLKYSASSKQLAQLVNMGLLRQEGERRGRKYFKSF